MSDSPEQSTETTGPVSAQPVVAPPPPPPVAEPHRRSLLTSVAAWVGIVAGSVFIVAVIFFSGFILGAHSGGDHGHDRREAVMFKHRGEPPFPMGPMGQFERGPFIFRGPGSPPPADAPGAPGAPGTQAPSRP